MQSHGASLQAETAEPAAMRDEDRLWPLAKLRNASRLLGDAPQLQKRKRAVLLTTGAMNPVHKGHLQMIHQARERLEAEGYSVVGAWLSPSHDGYVQPKAASLRTPGLCASFRLELARRAVQDDNIIAVGSWEASQEGRWPDFPVVAEALQKELRRRPEGHDVRVFYVCGTDLFRKCGLHTGMRGGIGVVAVPRKASGETASRESSGRERPDKLVYFAAPAGGEVASYSSTKVRQALKSADYKFVCEAISEKASTLLFRPAPQELDVFSTEYEKLGLLQVVQDSVGNTTSTAPSASLDD